MAEQQVDQQQQQRSIVFGLIEQREWTALELYLTDHPEAAKLTTQNAKTALHALCAIGSTPLPLIETVATLAPETILMEEGGYGDTCLHIICRNSQFSHHKLQALVSALPPDSTIHVTNQGGGTALHSAANHNATIETLALLIRTCPSILNVRTPDRRHVLDVLFEGFLYTIHGHMHIIKILEANEDIIPQSSIFDRFWNKIRLMALSTYFASDRSMSHHTKDGTFTTDDDQYLVHGMLLCGNIPNKLLRLTLQLTQAAATARDRWGNTPLHYYVAREHSKVRPHRAEIRELLRPAASVRNHAGHLPMHFAIRDRLPYHDYWGLVVDAHANTIDPETNLPPALLAASVGGKEAINSCFCLLRNHPEQIKV